MGRVRGCAGSPSPGSLGTSLLLSSPQPCPLEQVLWAGCGAPWPLLAGPDSQAWSAWPRAQSSRVRCKQAWKTRLKAGACNHRSDNVYKNNQHRHMELGQPPRGTGWPMAPHLSPAAWAEARRVGTLVTRLETQGKGASGLPSPRPQLRAERGGIRGSMKPGRPLGTWPKDPSKVLGPFPPTPW